MPKLPTDMDASRAYTKKQARVRAAADAKAKAAEAHDMQILRDFANELAAKQGLPPLRPDEPLKAIICKRGRR